jgi:DNA-directed RNA polymerase subunit M/transcription elongation factor TFIIS
LPISDRMSQKSTSKEPNGATLSRPDGWYNLCFSSVGMQTNSTEHSESSANTIRDLVFQCPRCRTTLKLDRATAGTTLKCESCQQLIRVPRSRSAKKVSDQAEPVNPEQPADLEHCLKENESQRTEITGYINQLNIQLHRWQLRLQTLNERKQQLEAERVSRKT